MKLMIRAATKVQLSSSNLLRKGFALPLLFWKEKTFQAL